MRHYALADLRGRVRWYSGVEPEMRNEKILGSFPWQWGRTPADRERIEAEFCRAIVEPDERLLTVEAGKPGAWRLYRNRFCNLGDFSGPVMRIEYEAVPERAWLTPREQQVLRQICGDRTAAEASAAMGIRRSTYESYRSHLRHKVGARTTAGIVLYGLQSGLIDS